MLGISSRQFVFCEKTGPISGSGCGGDQATLATLGDGFELSPSVGQRQEKHRNMHGPDPPFSSGSNNVSGSSQQISDHLDPGPQVAAAVGTLSSSMIHLAPPTPQQQIAVLKNANPNKIAVTMPPLVSDTGTPEETAICAVPADNHNGVTPPAEYPAKTGENGASDKAGGAVTTSGGKTSSPPPGEDVQSDVEFKQSIKTSLAGGSGGGGGGGSVGDVAGTPLTLLTHALPAVLAGPLSIMPRNVAETRPQQAQQRKIGGASDHANTTAPSQTTVESGGSLDNGVHDQQGKTEGVFVCSCDGSAIAYAPSTTDDAVGDIRSPESSAGAFSSDCTDKSLAAIKQNFVFLRRALGTASEQQKQIHRDAVGKAEEQARQLRLLAIEHEKQITGLKERLAENEESLRSANKVLESLAESVEEIVTEQQKSEKDGGRRTAKPLLADLLDEENERMRIENYHLSTPLRSFRERECLDCRLLRQEVASLKAQMIEMAGSAEPAVAAACDSASTSATTPSTAASANIGVRKPLVAATVANLPPSSLGCSSLVIVSAAQPSPALDVGPVSAYDAENGTISDEIASAAAAAAIRSARAAFYANTPCEAHDAARAAAAAAILSARREDAFYARMECEEGDAKRAAAAAAIISAQCEEAFYSGIGFIEDDAERGAAGAAAADTHIDTVAAARGRGVSGDSGIGENGVDKNSSTTMSNNSLVAVTASSKLLTASGSPCSSGSSSFRYEHTAAPAALLRRGPETCRRRCTGITVNVIGGRDNARAYGWNERARTMRGALNGGFGVAGGGRARSSTGGNISSVVRRDAAARAGTDASIKGGRRGTQCVSGISATAAGTVRTFTARQTTTTIAGLHKKQTSGRLSAQRAGRYNAGRWKG